MRAAACRLQALAWQRRAQATIPPMHRVRVALGARSYDIDIAPGLIAQAGALLRPRLPAGRCLVVADSSAEQHHGARLRASLAAAGIDAVTEVFPAGERSKSLAQAELLWQACARHGIDRQGSIIAFGGGVAGDLAGFTAACWMRGIAFAQVPTTLLAMVDSSVGGKTGVNSAAGKNLIGAFQQPVAVVIDPELLATLGDRERKSGLAEVVKYGVIKDPVFLAWQEAHAAALAAGDAAAMAHAVAESCRIKAWYVEHDETEQGARAELNYGHTFGHALEQESHYDGSYLHGEAVAVGMGMAVDLARRLGVLADAALGARQDALLAACGLPVRHHAVDDAVLDRLVAYCRIDKKAAAGRMRFILPRAAGRVGLDVVTEADAVRAAFAGRSA
jgi:3-dehydroquinate synthase